MLLCVVVATPWSSAICYAQIASDSASDSVYADGWQGTTFNNATGVQESVGDNGGYGFEPWNFDTDWLFDPDPPDGLQDIDPSTTFNQIGTAWRIAKPLDDHLPRAGRGFAPLQVGQTISVVFDNPTEQQFNKGYFIRFNSRNGVTTGGGNLCYDYAGYSTCCSAADLNNDPEGHYVPIGADPVPKLEVRQYSWIDPADWGKWGVLNNADADPENEFHFIPLTDEQTAAQGARLDLKITAPDAYELTIDPTGPGATYVETGTMLSPGKPIDWIEFTFFNTVSVPGFDTDFYIRSMEITGPTTPTGDFDADGDKDGADFLAWQRGFGATGAAATRANGNADGDADVDGADLAVWRSSFGAAVAAGERVPEPTGCIMLAVGLCGLGRRSIVRKRHVLRGLPEAV
jgi:hypothetical protein